MVVGYLMTLTPVESNDYFPFAEKIRQTVATLEPAPDVVLAIDDRLAHVFGVESTEDLTTLYFNAGQNTADHEGKLGEIRFDHCEDRMVIVTLNQNAYDFFRARFPGADKDYISCPEGQIRLVRHETGPEPIIEAANN
jgi:hypothetical protein